MRQSQHDTEDELDGWYIKFRRRKKGHSGPRLGDIRVVDPIDSESFTSMAAIRRKLGLADGGGGGGGGSSEGRRRSASSAEGGVEGRTVGTRSTPHGATAFPSAPPPPEGWTWPTEGERIEVEVQVSDDSPPAWMPSTVLQVLVDGQFQARIELPDGSDRWEDWFSWQDEGADWRRKTASKKRKAAGNGAVAAAPETAPPTDSDALPAGWTEEERTTASMRRYSVFHGPSGERAQSRAAAWRAATTEGADTSEVAGPPRPGKPATPPEKPSKKPKPEARPKPEPRAKPEADPAPAAWPRQPLGGPALLAGEEALAGVRVEVVLHDEGLEGSRFSADVLELRGKGKKREAHVQYHALFDEPEGSEGGEMLLREWVSASELEPPPPPPPSSWYRNLKAGDEAEAQHEGGWWQVTVRARVPGNVRLKEPPQFVVEASGYGVTRTVAVADLRPRS